MGVSYSAKDETIDRLLETNRVLRDEIVLLKKAATAKDENNLKLAEKVKEQENKIKALEDELDKAIDLHKNGIKLTPFEASVCVSRAVSTLPFFRKSKVTFADGRLYNYADALEAAAAILRDLDGEKCS